MSKIFVYDLMTISRVLVLIIGQNDINPKLLQPILASICKVMAVEKSCVQICTFSLFCFVFVPNSEFNVRPWWVAVEVTHIPLQDRNEARVWGRKKQLFMILKATSILILHKIVLC